MNDFDNEEQSMRTMRGDTNEGTLGRIDQYEIIRKLGGGGFGVVYLVRDTQSDVEYAIKTLHPLLKSNPEEMENLRSQFKLVSKLNHSHIASAMYLHPVKEVVYANEEVRKELRLSPGDFVMVMKYAPGVTLSQWRKQFPNGVVPVDKAIEICKQVASALDYAHSEKIIHRDIKPSNVMVETREDGTTIARVLDFGLAAEIRSSMSRVSTEKGDTSGTRPYMAPEQWQGKKQGPATDQYALACMFYELVSGAVPFAGAFETGDFNAMMYAVENRTAEQLLELSTYQNKVLKRALSKDMTKRFASCGEFITKLSSKRKTGKSAFIIALLLLLGAVALYFTKSSVEQQTTDVIDDAEEIIEPPRITVAGIDMVQIPDSAVHKGLYFGKYEVTQAQWQAIMENNPSYFTGDLSRPVESVSWDDCQEFIKKLNARTEVKSAGITFRLPTEEEWVYACRAGSKGKYGLLADGREGSLDEMGWYEDNSCYETHPVGQKKPNAWGLYDMHGNVYEWTASADGENRIHRGGGYYRDASYCESGFRVWADPEESVGFLGFRLAASRTTQVLETEHKAPMKTEVELKASKKAEIEREIFVAGIDMVSIPDNATHKGLYFGKYEVTQAQWLSIMGNNPSYFTGDLYLPVENVSWYDCQKFIEKLNALPEVKQAGVTFFLPTEEQWEYACRAGSTGKYGLLADGRGGTLDEMGWYEDNSGNKTHPVGQKKPNAWGLYDMHGNVKEWTASAFCLSNSKCLRGGSYYDSAFDCVSGISYGFNPFSNRHHLGFRLVASRTVY